MIRVVVTASLRDPMLKELSGRPALIVAGEDAPPVRFLGANTVGMGVGALAVRYLGNSALVVAAADGEQAGRALAKDHRWRLALVVLLPRQSGAVRLQQVAAEAEASGRKVVVVELVDGLCLELGIVNNEIQGFPASGIRAVLSESPAEAPSVPSEGPGTPHPSASPALHSMVVPDEWQEIPPLDPPAPDPAPAPDAPASARRQKPPKKQSIT